MSQKYMTWQMETERSKEWKKWEKWTLGSEYMFAIKWQKCFCFICAVRERERISEPFPFEGYISFDRFLSCAHLFHSCISCTHCLHSICFHFLPRNDLCAVRRPILLLSILWSFHKECLWNFIWSSEHLDLLPFSCSILFHSTMQSTH